MANSNRDGKHPQGPPPCGQPFVLDLRLVKANTGQARRLGAVPNLNAAGHGLFESVAGHEGNQPLWPMLVGDEPELWRAAVRLIDECEPDIKELADTIAACTQLHSVGVVALDGADRSKGYDVVYGMRRCIARAYNHARSGGELPLTVRAELLRGGERPGNRTPPV